MEMSDWYGEHARGMPVVVSSDNDVIVISSSESDADTEPESENNECSFQRHSQSRPKTSTLSSLPIVVNYSKSKHAVDLSGRPCFVLKKEIRSQISTGSPKKEEELPDLSPTYPDIPVPAAKDRKSSVPCIKPCDYGGTKKVDCSTYKSPGMTGTRETLTSLPNHDIEGISSSEQQIFKQSLQQSVHEDEAQNKDTRWRICNERQAYSSPIKMNYSIASLTPPSSPQMNSDDKPLTIDPAQGHGWLTPEHELNGSPKLLTNPSLVPHDKLCDSHIIETMDYSENKSASGGLCANLERNVVFGPYSSSFLPISSIVPSGTPLNIYHHQFIETALEDGQLDVALSFLKDFTSKYRPVEYLLEMFISYQSGREAESVKLDQSQLSCALLALYQRHPEAIPSSIDRLLEAIISLDEECTNGFLASLQFTASLFLKILELNLFTRNLCDNIKIRHSLAHTLLSWDKGRRNIKQLIRLLFRVVKTGKLSLLYDLQHLIALGLESSITDEFHAVRSCAYEMKEIYLDLREGQQRQLLIRSIEKPALTLWVTRLIIEHRYHVQPVLDMFPPVEHLVEAYFRAVPKMDYMQTLPYTSDQQQRMAESSCEELAVLLYFLIWSSMQCTKYRTHENRRARLLKPSMGTPTASLVRHPNVTQHLQSLCPYLSLVTYEYLTQIDCLLSTVGTTQ